MTHIFAKIDIFPETTSNIPDKKLIAGSNSKCKDSGNLDAKLKEPVFRGVEVEFFPWSPVDFVLDLLDGIVANVLEVSTFWDVLSDEFVGVFYSPFLPGRIRVGKEDGYTLEGLGQVGMAGELKAVVGGDGEHMLPVREQQPRCGSGHLLGVLPVREEFDEEEVGAAFGEREDGSAAVLARDEIHLPVAETLAVCLRRTVVYAHAIGDAPDSPDGTLPVLELVAATLVEFTTFQPVPANDLVYRLMGYADTLERHPARYLLWRPLLLAQQPHRLVRHTLGDLPVPGKSLLAHVGQLLRQAVRVRPVLPLVAARLPIDGRHGHAYRGRDVFFLPVLFEQHLNCVSLLRD